MNKTNRKNSRTILSSMEEVVSMAKEHSLSEKFYEEAEKSLKYIARVLLLSKDEALILSLFFEKSSSWRIRISDIAEMINTSNIRIISMMNIADGLAKKGYLQESNSKEERYYTVPMEVIDSIRRNVCYIPKPLSNLTFDEFFDRLSNIFDDDDIALWRRENKLYDLVSANMHLPYCKVASSYELKNFDFILLHLFANRLINEDDDMIGTHDWEDIIDSKRAVRRILKELKSGESPLIQKGILGHLQTSVA